MRCRGVWVGCGWDVGGVGESVGGMWVRCG